MRLTAKHKFACLTYHVIGEGTNQYTLRKGQLHAHLRFLKAEDYIVDDFEGLETGLRSHQFVPSRYVVLTVDDGHDSSMRAADVLQAYGYRATFFLTRDRCLGKPHFVREPQIRELRKRGFSIGTHGTTHRKFTFMPEQLCVQELRASKQWLEDVIGEEVRYTAAPGGYIDGRVLRLAYGCGYVLAATCAELTNSPETITLPGKVNRVNVRQHFSLRTFRHAVEGYAGFYLWRQFRAAALTVPKRLLG